MIRRKISENDHVCLLVFDHYKSGANIFDAATLDESNGISQVSSNDPSLRGLIASHQQKNLFSWQGPKIKLAAAAGAKQQHNTWTAHGQRVLNRLAETSENTDCRGRSRRIRWWQFRSDPGVDSRSLQMIRGPRDRTSPTTLGLIPASACRLPRLARVQKPLK